MAILSIDLSIVIPQEFSPRGSDPLAFWTFTLPVCVCVCVCVCSPSSSKPLLRGVMRDLVSEGEKQKNIVMDVTEEGLEVLQSSSSAGL